MDNITAIIAAAGKGTRFKKPYNKLLTKIDGEEILLTTFKKFDANIYINRIIVTASTDDIEIYKELLKSKTKKVDFVLGGETRFDSVKNALNTIDNGIVLIHDGARPYISSNQITILINETKKYGSAILCSKPINTICSTDGKDTILFSNRTKMLSAETPQCFYAEKIKKAYSLVQDSKDFTDDAGVYTSYIGPCHAVINQEYNKKITFQEDLSSNIKIGNGFDLHKLVEGRKLILGGIEIPHTKGLLGHSDADVLIHSIMDSLLSAASLRDIGYYFPDSDPKYEGIDSTILLSKVLSMIEAKGYKISNITACIMAEKPKLSKYVESIIDNIINILDIRKDQLSITLTTLEGIGVIGREEGIAVQSYCILKKY